jgi:hypothetical protein
MKMEPLKESNYYGWRENMEATLRLKDLWGPVVHEDEWIHYKNAHLSQPRESPCECLPSELPEPPIARHKASDSIKLTHFTLKMFSVRWFCSSARDVATDNLYDVAPCVPSTYPDVLAQSAEERTKRDQRDFL